MNAILRGKREWEHWHYEQLGSAADLAVGLFLKAMGWTVILISFFRFISYKGGKLFLWLVAAALQGGRPLIQKAPHLFVEVSEEYPELYSAEAQNPFLRK